MILDLEMPKRWCEILNFLPNPTLRSACRNMARKTGERAPRMALCAVKRLSLEGEGDEDAESPEEEEELFLGRHISVTSHSD